MIFSILILSTAIGIGSSRSPASQQEDAYKALLKATYIETGANKTMKELEKKYVPKEIKEYAGWITGTTKIITEKKISFEWTY